MQKDEIIDDFLNNQHRPIWNSIIHNDISSLKHQFPLKNNNWSFLSKTQSLFKTEILEDSFINIISELFNIGESSTLEKQKFKIMVEKSDELFKNLVRLLFAIALNGNLKDLETIVRKKVINSTSEIAEEIRIKADGYPQKPINGLVWMCGASMRVAFDYLVYYYKKIGMLENQIYVQKMKTIITLNIMGHYKNLVGPDMIKIATLEEEKGLIEDAISRYNAIILDFECELEYFYDESDAQLNEEDVFTLDSLLKSYKNINRLKGENKYEKKIKFIENLLA